MDPLQFLQVVTNYLQIPASYYDYELAIRKDS